MIRDRERVAAYLAALEAAIRPGSVVVDIGTGTGLFACAACRLGARRVYAIEKDDVIEVAREIALAGGYADRIEFLHASSLDVELPERANVVLSDLRGRVPLYGRNLMAVMDARERFLADDGVLIPACDRVRGALVDAGPRYSRLLEPAPSETGDVDMSPARRYALNETHEYRAEGSLLSEPFEVATIDYRTLRRTDIAFTERVEATAAGVVNGLALWFDAEVGGGRAFSNGPAEREGSVYGQLLFPLLDPLAVRPGDGVDVAVRANLRWDGYSWTWSAARAGETVRRQSTLLGAPMPPGRIARAAETYRPTATRKAELDRLVLELMDGTHSLGEIADELRRRWPDAFPVRQAALDRAARLALRYAGP